MANTSFFENLHGEFLNILNAVKGKKVAIFGHMRPDGDCIGSQTAMYLLLKNCGVKDVVCVNKDPVPAICQKFAVAEFVRAENFNDADYEIICVDCADFARILENAEKIFKKPLACIDHHITNKTYATYNVINPKAAATAELLAGLMLDLNIKISSEQANALYLGLATDTRQFTTNSTTATSLKIAGLLVENKADISSISIELYQREKFAKQKLLARYLESVKLYENGRICGGTITLNDYAQTGATKEDADGLVDFARAVDGVQIAFVVEELKDGAKASLRSKSEKYAMNEVANFFGGGGHACAAGCSVKMGVAEFTAKLLEQLAKKL